MGIPSYFSYIVRNHPDIIQSFTDIFLVHNLYLDCNSIVYDVIYSSKLNDADAIISAVCDKIDKYILDVAPKNTIFIAFDGVAPLAKLEQQRTRRYKSLYQSTITKSIFKDTPSNVWNTVSITPGTTFMKKLNVRIREKYNNPLEYNVKTIIASPSDIYGEGEHKIFEYIRQNGSQHADQTTLVYGLDADLIMLCINHLHICPNIYLFRETPEFIKSINSELNPNEKYILNIPKLANIIALDMNNNMPLTTKQQLNRIYDYIFMCFFLGNDFMPHFPAINIRTGGVDKMINAYKHTIGSKNINLTDGTKIYWKNVNDLVYFLAELEHEYIIDETKLRDKKSKYKLPNSTPEDLFKNFEILPTYERNTELLIDPFKPNWQQRYYKYLFNVNINEDIKKQICINYLEGLEWNMKYYTIGCPDWRWKYEYNYPPLLEDLIHYIPYANKTFVRSKIPKPVSPYVQLAYVLPKQNLDLLPTHIYEKLVKQYPEWYRTDCEFIWSYCRYFWESHVDLPNIDINKLEKMLNKLTIKQSHN